MTKSLLILSFLFVFCTSSLQAQFTITAQGPTDICSGIVTLAVDNPQPNIIYSWFVGSYFCSGAGGSPFPYGNSGPVLQVMGTGEFHCISFDPSGGPSLISNPITVRIMSGSLGSMLLPAPYFQSPVNCLTSVPLCIPTVFYASFPNTLIKWYKDNVQIAGAGSSGYNATSSGYFKYSINVGACTINYSDSVLVNIPPANPIIASQPSPVCAGSSVNFSVINAAPGSTYSWEVSISGGIYNPFGTGTSINYTIPSSGFINMRARVTNSGCSQVSNILTLQIQNLNLLVSPGGNFSVCTGTTTNFVASSIVPNPFYQWYRNGNTIPGATGSLYSTNQAGTYYVSLTYTCGVVNSTPVTMTVNALPAASITSAGSTTFCGGGNVTLNANTGTGLTYQWKKYANNIVGATGPSLNVTSGGKYKVIVTNAAGCSRGSNSITVTVNPLPTAVISALSSTSICAGDSVVLLANQGAGFTYQWKKYSNNIAGAVNITYSAKTTGNYKCIVTNANGCSRTSNGIVVNVVCREGEFAESTNETSVYPNPSNGDFYIRFSDFDEKQKSIVMYDVSGRIIEDYNLTETSNTLVISGLKSGVYLLNIQSSSGNEFRKIIKTD